MKLVKKLTFAFVATLAVSTLTACSLYTGIPGRDGKEKPALAGQICRD